MLDANTHYYGSICAFHKSGKAGNYTNFNFTTGNDCMFSNYTSFKYFIKIF